MKRGRARQALAPEEQAGEAEDHEDVARSLTERLTEIGERPEEDTGDRNPAGDGEQPATPRPGREDEQDQRAIGSDFERRPSLTEIEYRQERRGYRIVPVPVPGVAIHQIRSRVRTFLDQPLQHGAPVSLPAIPVVDQRGDHIAPEVVVSIGDHLENRTIEILVEPPPALQPKPVVLDQLAGGERLSNPLAERLAGELGHPQSQKQVACIGRDDQSQRPRPGPRREGQPETYRGNVSCTGPRACYDESKRYGEALCVTFVRVYDLPITIARPFNNYGPGLKITDRRVLADFARDLFAGRDIVLLSDGSPTRTFCYVADAIVGYYKVLVRGRPGEAYNIGVSEPEISMADLAQRVVTLGRELFAYGGQVRLGASDDTSYLIDNPRRRCPAIHKAKADLGYDPKIPLDEGLRRTLIWYAEHRDVVEAAR